MSTADRASRSLFGAPAFANIYQNRAASGLSLTGLRALQNKKDLDSPHLSEEI